jgi:DNA polymerase-3 subunit epsilon
MWTDGTLVSFDLETTGVDTETARIVTASVVVIEGATGKYETHEWLVNPGVDIPDEAAKVHGITTEHAREHGEEPHVALHAIVGAINHQCQRGAALIIYNAAYDLTLLDREMRRHHGVSAVGEHTPKIVDPLVLDRHLDRYRKGKRTLAVVSAHYGVPISEADAHGSTADALCAARVAWTIGRRFPVECADLSAMQEMQRRAHREWADHLGEYLTKQGKPDDVDRAWPIRPYVAEAVA